MNFLAPAEQLCIRTPLIKLCSIYRPSAHFGQYCTLELSKKIALKLIGLSVTVSICSRKMQFYRHQDTSSKMPPILSYCIHVAMTATVNSRFEKKLPKITNKNLGQQFLLKDYYFFICAKKK